VSICYNTDNLICQLPLFSNSRLQMTGNLSRLHLILLPPAKQKLDFMSSTKRRHALWRGNAEKRNLYTFSEGNAFHTIFVELWTT